MSRYYVAYGSNLNSKQMLEERCKGAKLLGTSYIEDYQLLFKGTRYNSHLTIEKKEGCKVPVAIWEVTEEHEHTLDYCEGCPYVYYKTYMELEVNGETVTAFVYIMHEEKPLGVPSDVYYEKCVTGYKEFGFDVRYLEEAKQISEEYINRFSY